ncbi:nuclear transport factor 2 family protein [Mycolicibacterium neoaurum]|uniref:nuclear transport factor 2 family protein n=1 Tax=Mycolicibacterium neoaurum TaxID=1795 RepID=UPI001F4CD7B7|nr:nuclear transport factor 2 family protein [Mycolicibacterium neoaurum]
MTSAPNKGIEAEKAEDVLALFERWHDAHEASDYEGLAGVLAEDVEIHSMFKPEPVAGRPAALEHFRGTVSRFTDFGMPLLSAPAASDAGIAFAEVVFTGTFTGELTWRGILHRGRRQAFEVPGVIVLHTAGNMVTSVKTLFDRDDWLGQIGVDCSVN